MGLIALPKSAAWRRHAVRDGFDGRWEGDMEQLVSAALAPGGSLRALLRVCRQRALLSQEQLAARAGLSERTVRDLEAGRVRSPRTDTVRLLADALQLSGSAGGRPRGPGPASGWGPRHPERADWRRCRAVPPPSCR